MNRRRKESYNEIRKYEEKTINGRLLQIKKRNYEERRET
jgi:hypothetical protein